MCQVCGKVSHTAIKCYFRFDHACQSDPPRTLTVNYTSSSPYPDQSWYPNTAATNHITSELSHFNVTATPYGDSDHIRTSDGTPLSIANIGDSTFSTQSHSFILRNLLHVPSITKNLISIQKFCLDNSVIFEFHSTFFVVKDAKMGTPLFHGSALNGLYPFTKSLPTFVSTQALVGEYTTPSQWHSHLGHPSLQIVSRIIHKY